MKTILCNEYQKNRILNAYASKNNGVVHGISCITLPQLLKTEDNESTSVLALQCMHTLLEQKETFPIFQDMFVYPQFIDEMMRFARELVLYEVPVEALPKDSPSEKELYGILSIILSMNLPEKQTIKNREKVVQSLLENPDLFIEESFETNLFHYRLKQELKKHGVFQQAVSRTENPILRLRYGLNTRQELEAVAQEIVKKQRDTTVILTSKDQIPVCKQVFARYEIPFSFVQDDKTVHMPGVFAALLEFSFRKDKESFLTCLRTDAFGVHCSHNLYTWLNQIMRSDLSMEEDIAKKIAETPLTKDAKKISALEEQQKAFFQEIQESYNLLCQSQTPQEMIQNAYHVMSLSPALKEKDELQAALKVRSFLQEIMSDVQQDTDIAFITEHIRRISLQMSGGTNTVTVTDLTHPLPSASFAYVVGCHGKNFPAFPTRKGIFDENYVKKIPQFPQLSQRHEAYLIQLHWIDTCAKQITFSYATNDYQGRELQLSYDIEQKFDKETIQHPKKWDLQRMMPSVQAKHEISADTAAQLFFKDGRIHGSISTIEKFFQCPYSYFIQSGLKVSRFEKNGLDAASIGDLQHAVLEQAVKTYAKDYAEHLSTEEISAVFDTYFDAYRLQYPNLAYRYDLTKERLLKSFLSIRQFLSDMEKENSFVPTHAEYVFRDEEYFDHITLNGKIDRIDTTDFLFRILDYKSSSHSLTQSKVKAGLQLQLLTYLLIAQKNLGLKPVGSYYVNLSETPLTIFPRHISRNVVTELSSDEETQYQNMIGAHRLEGWTYDDIHAVTNDQNGTFIKGTEKLYDIALIDQCMHEIYQYFYDAVSKGTIEPHPIEGTCQYCDYHSICRFHGQQMPSDAIACKDIDLQVGKNEMKEDD